LKKLAAVGGGAVVAVLAVLAGHGHAAGRVNALGARPMAEIADLYAWSSSASLNLVIDVSPLDDGTHSFDPAVVYVFHLTSKPGLGVAIPGGTETEVICRFASNTSVECWALGATGTTDYVTGDPSSAAGVASPRGKLRVFAGRRSDPAFFNQSGLAMAVTAIKAVPTTPPADAAGCPNPLAFDAGRTLGVRNALNNGSDAFAATNVMAIVVQIDKSLVNDGNTIVAVWASTHEGS
jgi:hypothetical protein